MEERDMKKEKKFAKCFTCGKDTKIEEKDLAGDSDFCSENELVFCSDACHNRFKRWKNELQNL